MAISVSTGISSGIDYNAIIEATLAVDQVTIDKYESQKTTFESEISALGKIKSGLSSIQDAVDALADPDEFFGYSATSSDESILTTEVTGNPAPGTYYVEVTQIATPEILVGSDGFSSRETDIGGGTLSIAVGSGDAIEIEVTDTASSLENIVDAINDSDAEVTASIVEVSDGAYALSLMADENGQSITFSISDDDGDDTDASGLSSLYADPATETMTTAQSAANAEYKLGTMEFESSSNEIDGLIDGVTLNLESAAVGTTVTIQVEEDNSSTAEKIQTFVDAYNSIADTMALYQDAGDEESYGVLLGDSTTNRLRSRLQSLLFTTVETGNSNISYLSSLGVEMGDDGKLTFNESTFEDALDEDPDAVLDFFTTEDTGFAALADSTLEAYTKYDGILDAKMDGLGETVSRIGDKVDTLEDKLDVTEDRLRTRYAALETLLSGLMGTQSSLISLLGSLSTTSS
jgi:flagellar hook-associated protein 2